MTNKINVIKRDESVVDFDIEKIKKAISLAMDADERDEYNFRILVETIEKEIRDYYIDYVYIENI